MADDASVQWTEAVALAQRTGDYADVADAAAAVQRAFAGPKCAAALADPAAHTRLLDLVRSDRADTAALRAAALRVLGRAGDTAPETLRAAAACFAPRAPCEVVAAAQAFFAHSPCAFAPVADELRAAAAASDVVALRLAECVLAGQQQAQEQQAQDAWRADQTAAHCLAQLTRMLGSPDIAIALNAAELVGAPARWDDARDAPQSRAQLAALARVAEDAHAPRLVRVAALRALGGVAARGPCALDAAAQLGVFALLERCVRAEDTGRGGDDAEAEAAAAALCALAQTADGAGVAAVRVVAACAPGLLDAVVAAAAPTRTGSAAVHVAAVHALASALGAPGHETPAGAALLRGAVFARLQPSAGAVVADAVRAACGGAEDRARAGTRLLGALAQHAWAADALLACAPLTATLLARDHAHVGAAERWALARALLRHRPDAARTHPDLARLAAHGPHYRPAQPLVHTDP